MLACAHIGGPYQSDIKSILRSHDTLYRAILRQARKGHSIFNLVTKRITYSICSGSLVAAAHTPSRVNQRRSILLVNPRLDSPLGIGRHLRARL